MRIAITGATGLIGRNLLFEIIKQNINNLNDVEIIVLGRNKDGTDIHSRIQDIVLSDGISYVSATKSQYAQVKDYCKTGIKSVCADLDANKLGLGRDDFSYLKSSPIDLFFHLAALTDLRNTPVIEKALEKTNVTGTQQVIDLISSLDVHEFCYTGTAYSCGNISGNVKPDYINSSNSFRNPYEKTKLQAEILVRNFSKKAKLRCRYFRPSVTCGRLIEPPIGSVNKFDVFYGWAAFFFQIKLKELLRNQDIYEKKINLNIRLCYNLKSGLNIVPADYAAKIMYQVCMRNDLGNSYFLVNNQETPHSVYIPLMLKALNISGPTQVDKIPEQMNHIERLYYKTAGRVFTPYITCEPILFDVSNLAGVLRKTNLSCPVVDEKTFPMLMKYAKKENFGLDKKSLQSIID